MNRGRSRASSKIVIQSWKKATQDLADAFVKKYYGNDASNVYWIGDEIGDIYCVNDYFWNVDRMKEALELNATADQLFEYYDKSLEAHEKQEPLKMNFKNFVRYGWII